MPALDATTCIVGFSKPLCVGMQVQRASGAYMVNQRRQSMHMTAASPMPLSRAPSSRLASGMLETFSSLNSEDNGDMNLDPELAEDEEFAAEEHAHRCCS